MSISEVRVLLDGLAIGESPRWHDGRLWFSHWGVAEVLAVDLDGNCEVMAPGRPKLGWATGWLPDGRLLVTGETLLRRERDGTFVEHADLSSVFTRGAASSSSTAAATSMSTASSSTSSAAANQPAV